MAPHRSGRLRGVALATTVGAACLLAPASTAAASPPFTPVAAANPKVAGMAAPNELAPELAESIVAQGSWPLENPTKTIGFYGYLADGPMLPAAGTTAEASKTEPDKNTYLVLPGQHGPDPSYDYGRQFLFQGHEGAAGYITRINLQADPGHRVTLLASTDRNGNALPLFDGSTWDPFARRLLFTSENGLKGGVWAATADYPSTVDDVSGVLGRGGYEGIQVDGRGNLWIVEDVGGAAGSGTLARAKQPNSFIYRFVPANPTDLTKGGKLQALRVTGRNGTPIVFGGTTQAQVDADIKSTAMQDLHTYGLTFSTAWVTLHDTAIDGTAPFDANALAKAAGATPFKRPENGVFRPGTGFREFYFTETGDTNADSGANGSFGGWGGVFRLDLKGPDAGTGTLRILYRGDEAHTGLDNIAFLGHDQLGVVEDAGDGLHGQRNALDSAYALDPNAKGAQPPIRFLAEGRDASATIDSSLGGVTGFQNEGDNEITGLFASDGDPSIDGLLATRNPTFFGHGDDRRAGAWRVFWTQQHGDNVTWELTVR